MARQARFSFADLNLKGRLTSKKQKTPSFSAKPYYAASWGFLRRDLLLLLVKLVAKIIISMIWVATLFGLLGVSLLGILRGIDRSLAPQIQLAQAFDSTYEILSRPTLLPGIIGILVSVWLLNISLDAFARAGIWGVLAARTVGERGTSKHASQKRSFWARHMGSLSGVTSHALHHFSRVLRLRLLGFAPQTAAILLAIITIRALFLATTGNGGLAGAAPLLKAVMWAAPLTLVSAFGILIRLSVEFSTAALMLEAQEPRSLQDKARNSENLSKKPAEALLDGAKLVVSRFVPTYRIFLFAAKLLLVPLTLNWLIAMGQALAPDSPGIVALLGLLRLVGHLLLFGATAVIAVLLRGAIFAYYAEHINLRPPAHARKGHTTFDSSNKTNTHFVAANHSTKNRVNNSLAMTKQTTLQDFLPQTYPNIIPIGALRPAPSPADEPIAADMPAKSEALDEIIEPSAANFSSTSVGSSSAVDRPTDSSQEAEHSRNIPRPTGLPTPKKPSNDAQNTSLKNPAALPRPKLQPPQLQPPGEGSSEPKDSDDAQRSDDGTFE